ncbi:MAG: hypothetical protein GTO14_22905 [Anaerolineales bacterium]|nr:hypothetical protein [Anaerolineales bacterium]
MLEMPQEKVGIVACSGEELPEGTVTRLAALRVLQELRPKDTVTICLPLFLAGGEGDRAFARLFPTIAIDGCEKRCAARGTEMYSGEPAASVVVTELIAKYALERPEGLRQLNNAGLQAVDVTANEVASLVDQSLKREFSHAASAPLEQRPALSSIEDVVEAACSCVSEIPTQEILVDGQIVELVALPLIFEQFRETGKAASEQTASEILEVVKVYNPILEGEERVYVDALQRAYAAFYSDEESDK